MLYELPNSYLARAYLQERSDRFVVEELFVAREEHHQRQFLRLQEEHDFAELLAVFSYSKQEVVLAAHQDGELELLSKRLQEQHNMTTRRWDIERLAVRAEDEQEALRTRQHEVDRSMMQRDEQLRVAEAAWHKTSAAMDVQIAALKKDIGNMNERVMRRDQDASINVLVADQSQLQRRAPGSPLPSHRRVQIHSDISSVTERTNAALARASHVLAQGTVASPPRN